MQLFDSLMRRIGLGRGFPEIKQIAEKHALRDDHIAYERALSRYDSGIIFDGACDLRSFTGTGKGRYTLNCYRKLRCDGRLLFEKTYSVESLDWTKCQYFYAHIHPRLNQTAIRVPALLWSMTGKRLAVARFDYVDFSPVTSQSYMGEAVSISKQLSSLGPALPCVPADLLDLSKHFGFERCFQKTVGVIERAGENAELLRSMRSRCEALPRFIGHGDLSRPNMGQDTLLLDWDNFGFYPPGFDLALAAVLAGDLLGGSELRKLASKVYEPVNEHCSFQDFCFSLIFFYGVFLSARKAEHKLSCLRLLERNLEGSVCRAVAFN
ncbi:hypothetical protein [Stutzerimonas stutzeri]|uniref:hypothetical protein n=1 Tax=Stutzerimonas stutzeri TaxID=316 RepID=UPI0004B756A2|nr:hypothetical protein [Stutzerimonas stutzeri]MCQ4329934.1 hypothetical protein [Stutzerimonas stutzeri]